MIERVRSERLGGLETGMAVAQLTQHLLFADDQCPGDGLLSQHAGELGSLEQAACVVAFSGPWRRPHRPHI
jgi:hypothetical protein